MTTRDALGSQQETGDSGIVVGHRLGAVLDGGLGPSGATNSVGGERQRSASRAGTNACAFRPRHTIGTSTPAGSNPHLSCGYCLECTLLAGEQKPGLAGGIRGSP
jgi:hypothetical protein